LISSMSFSILSTSSRIRVRQSLACANREPRTRQRSSLSKVRGLRTAEPGAPGAPCVARQCCVSDYYGLVPRLRRAKGMARPRQLPGDPRQGPSSGRRLRLVSRGQEAFNGLERQERQLVRVTLRLIAVLLAWRLLFPLRYVVERLSGVRLPAGYSQPPSNAAAILAVCIALGFAALTAFAVVRLWTLRDSGRRAALICLVALLGTATITGLRRGRLTPWPITLAVYSLAVVVLLSPQARRVCGRRRTIHARKETGSPHKIEPDGRAHR
jgi:hypothetical protein